MLGPHPGPSLSPAALTPGTWQRPFRSPSPNSTRTREESRVQGPGATQRTRGAALLPLRTVSPNPGEAPHPHPHHSRVQHGHPTWGEAGQHPEDPGLRPLEASEAQGVTSAPCAPRAGLRGGRADPARQEANAPPSTSSGELRLPRRGDGLSPQHRSDTPVGVTPVRVCGKCAYVTLNGRLVAMKIFC